MKEVLKVSIARVSFTLEKDAYRTLEQYLDRLRVYYRTEVGQGEIIDDIEERVAELIIERGGKDRVITCDDIDSIINILGKPYDTDDSSFDSGISYGSEKIRKALYRDTTNKVIGGVCGGLGAYFKIDAVWVRILFILFFFLTSTPFLALGYHLFGLQMKWVFFMTIVYCILWAIIPAARTVAQKCAMHGESVSVDEIERKFRDGVRGMGNDVRDFGHRNGSGVFNTIGRVILFFIGAMLCLIGLSGLVTGWMLLLGLDIFSGISSIDLADYVQLNMGTMWLKVTAIMSYFLPFIGMLYAGIQLCFGFKSPKWKPGVIIFILWLVSLVAFITLTAIAFKPYYKHQEMTENIPLVKRYDTLYVKYPRAIEADRAKMYIEARRSKLELFYVNKIDKNNTEFVAYPSLRIYRQSVKEQPKIECEMNYFTNFSIFDQGENILDMADVVTIHDSLITVKPRIFSKQNKFAGDFQSLRLFVPKNTVVILQDPINHVFNSDQYYSTTNWFRRF